MPVELEGLDHFVLTVRDIDRTVGFYKEALGMEKEVFGQGRVALRFGTQKINLHSYPSPVDLVAENPRPGTGDYCLIAKTPLAEIEAHLKEQGIEIIAGPVERTGAGGPILSLYFRDPDGNLVEVANRL